MNIFDYVSKLKLLVIYNDGHYDALFHGDYKNRGNEIGIDHDPDYHAEFLRLYAIDHFHEQITCNNSIELYKYFNDKDVMLFHDNTNYREKDDKRHGLLIIPSNVTIPQLSLLMYTEEYMKETYEVINIIDMKLMGTKDHPIVSYEQLMEHVHGICPDPITGEISQPIEKSVQR